MAMPAQGIDWADADPALQGVVTEAVRTTGTRQPRLTEVVVADSIWTDMRVAAPAVPSPV